MNSAAFTPEEVEEGLLQDLLNYLLDYNKKSKKSYYDIHLYSDGYCTLIDWVDRFYDMNWEDDKFVLLKSDEVIQKEVRFPDDHYELMYPEDVDDRLKEWYEKHPEWVKTEYGTWTNMEENRRFNIDMQSEKWQEQNDVNESFFKIDANAVYLLEQAVCCVDEDILRRTDYVVLSKNAMLNFNYLGERCDDNIEKLEDIKIETTYPHNEKSTKNIIHVYVTNYLTDDAIYYLTDSNYLIHRLKVEIDYTSR